MPNERPPRPVMDRLVLRPAADVDAPAVASCVCEAYLHYIERIGTQPGPMLDDYRCVIREAQVQVAVLYARVVGAIVMRLTDEAFHVENVAVRPAVRGTGVGRALLTFAETEATRLGYASLYLATHELMVENRALYQAIGYVEYDHRVVNGFPRVFLRKRLE